jgi:hypothetical protein
LTVDFLPPRFSNAYSRVAVRLDIQSYLWIVLTTTLSIWTHDESNNLHINSSLSQGFLAIIQRMNVSLAQESTSLSTVHPSKNRDKLVAENTSLRPRLIYRHNQSSTPMIGINVS